MITNEKQFRSTRSLIDRFRVGLAALDTSSDVPSDVCGGAALGAHQPD